MFTLQYLHVSSRIYIYHLSRVNSTWIPQVVQTANLYARDLYGNEKKPWRSTLRDRFQVESVEVYKGNVIWDAASNSILIDVSTMPNGFKLKIL